MLKKHTFNVVVVGTGKGVGAGETAPQAHAVIFTGDRVEAKL
jgi:hypothetical protein